MSGVGGATVAPTGVMMISLSKWRGDEGMGTRGPSTGESGKDQLRSGIVDAESRVIPSKSIGSSGFPSDITLMLSRFQLEPGRGTTGPLPGDQ